MKTGKVLTFHLLTSARAYVTLTSISAVTCL